MGAEYSLHKYCSEALPLDTNEKPSTSDEQLDKDAKKELKHEMSSKSEQTISINKSITKRHSRSSSSKRSYRKYSYSKDIDSNSSSPRSRSSSRSRHHRSRIQIVRQRSNTSPVKLPQFNQKLKEFEIKLQQERLEKDILKAEICRLKIELARQSNDEYRTSKVPNMETTYSGHSTIQQMSPLSPLSESQQNIILSFPMTPDTLPSP